MAECAFLVPPPHKTLAPTSVKEQEKKVDSGPGAIKLTCLVNKDCGEVVPSNDIQVVNCTKQDQTLEIEHGNSEERIDMTRSSLGTKTTRIWSTQSNMTAVRHKRCLAADTNLTKTSWFHFRALESLSSH